MMYGHISWRGVIFICKDTRECKDDGTKKTSSPLLCWGHRKIFPWWLMLQENAVKTF